MPAFRDAGCYFRHQIKFKKKKKVRDRERAMTQEEWDVEFYELWIKTFRLYTVLIDGIIQEIQYSDFFKKGWQPLKFIR